MLFGEGILQAMNDYLFWDGGGGCGGGQGWRSGESTDLPSLWPGSNMLVEFVVRFSPLLREFFFSGFPLYSKPTFPNSIRLGMVDEEPLCGCATSKSSLFEKMRFIWVSIYLILIEDTIFTSPPSGDGTAILRSHRATKRSIRLQGKGSTFISQ